MRSSYLKVTIAAICWFAVILPHSNAQDYRLRAEYSTNWFNGQPSFDLAPIGTSCPLSGTYSTFTQQATGTSINFAIGADNPSDDMRNRWNASNVAYNTPTTFTFGCCNAGISTLAVAPTIGRYYTTRIQHNAYGDIQGIVMETANAPVSFTHVSAIDDKVVGCLSAVPSSGEKVFVRYTTSGGSAWQTIEATVGAVAGTTANDPACFTATIPLVSYDFYVITSTAADAAAVQANPELYTLRDYGTDVNGQAPSQTGCPKMANQRLETALPSVCVPAGGQKIVIDGIIDNPVGTTNYDGSAAAGFKYAHIVEAAFGHPFQAGATDRSDFIGESSANVNSYDANNFNYANWDYIGDNAGTSAGGDIKNFYVTWDNQYLYLALTGPNGCYGAVDYQDIFIAIDKDSDIATSVGGLPAPYALGTTLATAPWAKRVDFNGWKPDYFVAIERGHGTPGGDLARVVTAAGATVGEDTDDDVTPDDCTFQFVGRYGSGVNNGITEVRIPWATLGGRPSITNGQRMNFAAYTTADGDDFDINDSAPGLGQGHGKPFEQIGDCPWDADHWGGKKDPVTGVVDNSFAFGEALNGDPYDSRVADQGPGDNQSNSTNGRQPGSDNGKVNGVSVSDYDTVEAYWSIGNVGQLTSLLAITTTDQSIACSVSLGLADTLEAGVNIPYTSIPEPTGFDFVEMDGGSCFVPTMTVVVTKDSIGGIFDEMCATGCLGRKETIIYNYDITFPNRLVMPVPLCAVPTFANFDTLVTQEFNRGLTNGTATCELVVGSIGGIAFLDNFADGTEGNNTGTGTGTDTPLAGVIVTLYDAVTNMPVSGVMPITTLADGAYFFDNLPAGQYYVTFTAPMGYLTTDDNIGAGSTDSDNVLGRSQTVTVDVDGTYIATTTNSTDLTVGTFAHYTNIDAGFFQPINVAGVIQVDSAPETGATEGEAATPYLGGATVTLVMAGPDGIAGNGDDVTYTTTSSTVDGSFSFASQNIPPGTIVSLSYTTPAGFDAILPENATTLTTNNTLATGNTSITAANICPTCTVNGTGVLAGSGSNPSTISDLGQNNFGLGILGSIAGTIFFDNFADGTTANNNGTGGGTDPVYNAAGGGVIVILYDATTLLPVVGVAPITTDATGNYAFTNLPAGQYYVVAILPAGYSQSPTNSNSNATPTEDSDFAAGSLETPTITIGTAATVDPDFNGVLNITAPNANDIATGNVDYTQWDLGIYQPVTVTGTLYTQDGTGAFGAPAPNTPFTVTVTYTNSLGATSTVAIATTTDGNGDYSVTGFPPGNITSVTSTYGNIIATTVVCPTCPTTGSLQPSNGILPLQNFSLPIELSSFTGKMEGVANHLYWITATEQNTKYHIIERSANGTTGFTEIGRVDAAGNSTSTKLYQLEDSKPLAQSYYRLRTLDQDGQSQVSNTILLSRRKAGITGAQVYPVPATNQVTIAYETAEAGTVSFSVVDVLGRVLATEKVSVTQGYATKDINISHLAEGMYFIVIEDNDSHRQTLRIMKQ